MTAAAVAARCRASHPRLVLPHGWPSCFTEMLKLVPLLTDPGAHGGDPADAFDVVVPSLPGYGFSDHPARPGMGLFVIMARYWHALLTDGLGYQRYGTCGGDPVHQAADAGVRPDRLPGGTGRVDETDTEPLGRISVPTAVAVFPADLPSPPRSWVERTCNVQHWTEMPRGGHFPAAEEPELLAGDIRAFFRRLRPRS